MPLTGINTIIEQQLQEMADKHIRKGPEKVISGIIPARDAKGPRYLLTDFPDREFLRMNSNSYLGLSLDPEVIATGEKATRAFGTGPGAVRFISGSHLPHIELENSLATFHQREGAMVFNAAYAAVLGVLPPLISPTTMVISDELNHNSIINGTRLAKPAGKMIFRHLDMEDFELKLKISIGMAQRVVVVTDGIFSMRGDHTPLDEINKICARYENYFKQGIITVIDDSHGVGAFGETGRGVEEYVNSRADILIGTLGKAFGVNGGYVVSSAQLIEYLREKAPSYIYSNPISPAEAAAAARSIDIVSGPKGGTLLARLRQLTASLQQGLADLGHESLPGDHPIVPLMIRHPEKTAALVDHLFEHDILATGLHYPVVPKGDDEIRLQVSASHTEQDIRYLLEVISKFNWVPPATEETED